jgi:hypothetical protein
MIYLILLIALLLIPYCILGILFDYNWRLWDLSWWAVARNICCWPVMIALFHRNKVSDLIELIKHNEQKGGL